MTPLAKFLFSVKTADAADPVDVAVSPAGRSWEADGVRWYEIEYDPTTQLTVCVTMHKDETNPGHAVISNLQANGVQLNDLDRFGVYVRSDTGLPVTGAYGYMAWPGTYTFKLRFAPHIHSYMTHLLNVFSSKLDTIPE